MPRGDGTKPCSKAQHPAQVTDFHIGWLASLDRRTTLYQSLRNRLQALYDDLGGFNSLSVQQQSLCERVVFLEMRIRDIESRAVAGETIEWGVYGNLVNSLSGVLAKLGLVRRPKQIGTLQDYIEARS